MRRPRPESQSGRPGQRSPTRQRLIAAFREAAGAAARIVPPVPKPPRDGHLLTLFQIAPQPLCQQHRNEFHPSNPRSDTRDSSARVAGDTLGKMDPPWTTRTGRKSSPWRSSQPAHARNAHTTRLPWNSIASSLKETPHDSPVPSRAGERTIVGDVTPVARSSQRART